MRMLIEAQTFIDDLTPRDRVAVASFDSRLRIWLDFTSDSDAVRRVLGRGILFEDPHPVPGTSAVSLMQRLGGEAASKTYTIEGALRQIAEAIKDLSGAKSIVLVGHGFGRLLAEHVQAPPVFRKCPIHARLTLDDGLGEHATKVAVPFVRLAGMGISGTLR